MDIYEFYRLKEELEQEETTCFESGDPNLPGLWIDYRNNQGERRQFLIKNITSSPFNGCFEADCFSDFQYDRLTDFGVDSPEDLAITSHRTFKIANIILAKISYGSCG